MQDDFRTMRPSDDASTGAAATPARPDVASLVIIAAFFVAVVTAIFSAEPLQSANDRSRWCTVWSLVERGTYQIDEIQTVRGWATIDKVRHRTDDSEPWHFYSSKPPLFSTIVAGLYWLETHTLGFDLREQTAATTRVLLVLINALPMTMALRSLQTALQLLGVSRRSQRLLLLIAGFGTMLTPFLTTLNNHTPAAVCVIFCLTAMIRIRRTEQPRRADFLIVGASAALACCFELPAALFGLSTFLFVVLHSRRQTLRWYVPAAVVPLMLFFITNWICTGGIKPFYAYYGTEKYVYVHEGIPSYWSSPRDLDANAESPPVYAFHCLVGHHGILSLSPVFLLSLAGLFLRARDRVQYVLRPLLWMGALLSAAILTFYLSRTQNYNYGGNTAALRWMLWLTPFWWLAMIPVVELVSRRKSGIAVITILFGVSAYSVAYSLTTPWKANWIYVHLEQSGVIDYRTKTPPFDPARFALLRSVPADAGKTFTWFGSADAEGELLTIRTIARASVGDENGVIVEVTHHNSESTRSVNLVLLPARMIQPKDVRAWAAVPASEILDTNNLADNEVKLESGQLQSAPDWVVTRLRGLPQGRSYNAESPRYLRYRLPDGTRTAIPCERGAAQVTDADPGHGACQYRCDVLYSDEVPFGAAQWKITLTSKTSGEIVRRELWTNRHLPGNDDEPK